MADLDLALTRKSDAQVDALAEEFEVLATFVEYTSGNDLVPQGDTIPGDVP